ncbi:hypothetical protein CAL7716_072240 [Calothrix sp. PCC 7716]|nr:hypothetical protein CAL7716_072240 [Calothrix sp. PCC 7716]
MAVATRIDSALAATITQTSLVNALITAFTNAGYSAAFDNYTSGTDRVLIYRFDADASKTFGSNFLRIRVTTALVINVTIGTAFNTSTKALSNGSTEIVFTALSTTVNINFTALNAGSEARLVLLTQGATFIPLGMIIPANRPSWWNLDSWNYGFIFIASAMSVIRSSSISPYSNSDYEIFSSTRLSAINTQTNRRDVLTGLILLTQSNAGVAGKTSDDLGIAAATGSARFDTLSFPDNTQQFLLVNTGTSGFAVRVN